MNFYIREGVDGVYTLMTEDGGSIWTFASAEEAYDGCFEWDEISDVTCVEKISLYDH